MILEYNKIIEYSNNLPLGLHILIIISEFFRRASECYLSLDFNFTLWSTSYINNGTTAAVVTDV